MAARGSGTATNSFVLLLTLFLGGDGYAVGFSEECAGRPSDAGGDDWDDAARRVSLLQSRHEVKLPQEEHSERMHEGIAPPAPSAPAVDHARAHSNSTSPALEGPPPGQSADAPFSRKQTSSSPSPSRKQLQKDACLIMYHIPKCGGTSLHRFFRDNGLKVWKHYGTLDPNSRAPHSGQGHAESFLSADVYMGHWTPDFKQVLRDKFGMKRNCYEATVLRNPYERVASALFYHHPGYSQDQMIRLMKRGPVRKTIEYYNDECRRFGSAENVWDTYSHAYKNDNLAKASCNASAAVRRLSELDFVFSTDNYRNILDTLGTLFGLKDIKLPPTLNGSKSPGFNGLVPELQRLVSAGNEKDMEVFVSASDFMRAAPSGAPRTRDVYGG